MRATRAQDTDALSFSLRHPQQTLLAEQRQCPDVATECPTAGLLREQALEWGRPGRESLPSHLLAV